MNNENKLTNFLKYAAFQKEVSLIIAKNEEELKEFEEILDKNHFKKASHVSQLLLYIDSPSKLYFHINSNLPKELYDFILQYPTGQVEIFDKNKMSSTVTTPSYSDVSVILLITKEKLSQIQNGELEILSHVGLTYQN